MMKNVRTPIRRLLTASILAALHASLASANVILVTGPCTLDAAIQSANSDTSVLGCLPGLGADTILIPGPQMVGELTRVTTDIAFVGLNAPPPPLFVDGPHRLFFIGDETHAPIVSFSNLALVGGIAQGGNATTGAGAGAGLGGGIFVYDGTVTIDQTSLSANSAAGGSTSGTVSAHDGGAGGGGMFGTGGAASVGFNYAGGSGSSGGFGGGGGGGGKTYPSEGGGADGGAGGGATGGSGGIGTTAPQGGGFGGGGGGGSAPGMNNGSLGGAAGGFGGGGGGGGGSGGTFNTVDVPGAGGTGGFGGGGGAGGGATAAIGGSGGMGGFGGGGGTGGVSLAAPGLGGFGGSDAGSYAGGAGAGFGGAIFVRSGHVTVTNSNLTGNQSVHGTSSNGGNGQAKGAAIFAMNTLANANGNDQGMPAALPAVTGCANTFASNAAPDAGTGNRDNVDVFGADRLGLTLACGDRIFADGLDPP